MSVIVGFFKGIWQRIKNLFTRAETKVENEVKSAEQALTSKINPPQSPK